jgi:hypothetical protein
VKNKTAQSAHRNISFTSEAIIGGIAEENEDKHNSIAD